MAEDKEIKGMMAGVLKQMSQEQGGIDPAELSEFLKKLEKADPNTRAQLISNFVKKVKEGGNQNDPRLLQAIAAAREEAKQANEGTFLGKKIPGLGKVGDLIAAQKAKSKVIEEWQVATKGTTGKRTAFFEALLGRDLGDLTKNIGLEKMESPERIKEAKEKFGLDKKQKTDRGSVSRATTRSTSINMKKILNIVTETQKMVKTIEKTMTKPSLKAGYTFDPRMAGGGRFKNAEGKIVSSKEATTTSSARTDALTAAINADEQPLVKLREFLEFKLKDFDPKKLQQSTDNILSSLDGATPTLGLLSVHDKLNILMRKGALSAVGGGGRGRGRGGGPRGGGRGRGLFGSIGGLAGAAAGGYLGYQLVDSFRDPNLEVVGGETLKQLASEATTPEEKRMIGDQIAAEKKDVKLQAGATAAGGAGAVTGAVVANKVAKSTVVKNVKSKTWDLFLNFVKKKAPKLFAKVGARLAAAGGMALVPGIGWISAAVTVVGSLWMAYDLYQLWQEFSALSDAEKELYNEEVQTKQSTNEVKPASVNETKSPVSAVDKTTLLGGSTVAAATMTAAAIPAVVGGAAAPTAPTSTPPKTILESAVEKAKEISAGGLSVAKKVASTVSNIFSGPTPRLDQVTTKQNAGVDTSGLQDGMQERLARMASAFQEVTGKKLMLTSAYRSDDKQMELWNAKYNELKAANPNATEAQLTKMTRKWVALPVALGGKGSAHNSGAAVDINSKGAAGIDAIDGMTFNGQQVSTDSFLAMFGLKRPLNHEPWHIQPLEGAPTPDNPDPNAKPMVADAKGNMVNLETGRSESIPTSPMMADSQKAALPPVSDYSGAAGLGPAGQPRGEGMEIGDRLADSGIAPASPGLGPAGQPRGPGMQIADSGSITPVPNMLGARVAEGSAALESSKITAQATPAATPPVIINNQNGSQQPIQPPKMPLPKASSRSSENSFNRALAKDFSHPTAFTSVGVV